MNISGVLVHTRPEQTNVVKNELDNLFGVEVHAATEDGRLVVTIENESAPMKNRGRQTLALRHYQPPYSETWNEKVSDGRPREAG